MLYVLAGNLITLSPFLLSKDNYAWSIKKWYPFEMNKNYLWIDHAWDMYLVFIGALVNCSYDSILSGNLFYLCSQFDIMSIRLKLLTNIAKDNNKDSEFEQIYLNNIIKHHQNMLK